MPWRQRCKLQHQCTSVGGRIHWFFLQISSLSTPSVTCAGHGGTEEEEGIRRSATSFLLFHHTVRLYFSLNLPWAVYGYGQVWLEESPFFCGGQGRKWATAFGVFCHSYLCASLPLLKEEAAHPALVSWCIEVPHSELRLIFWRQS